MATGVKPPAWFWIVALLLVAWDAIGVYFCVDQIQHGAMSAMWEHTPYHLAFYAALPIWYNWCYAVATFGGLLGGLALLLKERRAVILFWISLVAVVIQFGYIFAMTDMVAHQGAAKTVPFPIFIALVAAFAIWFSSMAARKGWIGQR
ncbi:hypothetical protein [Sphingomonas sp.]|jgi:hypothetical protein|uniref:hypothetical protein n=1 Tax=Sphingomonas sp. TaxID=28214 RepID=UPI002E3561E0|nr:hypothetical protein [Sphingomonas sp.]HEX4694878.1 hypothetical protein [Sphingomonas sp.]